MDYVESNLNTIIDSADELNLSEEHVVTIMYNLLCSINFLHKSNIIHRDIKPANILIDSKCVPVICDFGLARTCPKSNDSLNVSQELKQSSRGRQ